MCTSWAANACPSEEVAKPRALSESLSEILGGERLERISHLSRLRQRWSDIVGPMLAARSEPVSLDGNGLLIAVDHPAMAQQVRFLQAEIGQACRRICHIPDIRRVYTRIQAGCGTKPHSPASPLRSLTLSEKKRVARQLAGIRHRQLRQAIFKARLAEMAYRRQDDISGAS